ncbi:MAG: urease accessory protein UreE [Megamonas funiformis]|uniref:urease accessory protein UreE n=1 Tax=Megamonas funiformis TaxID=437897 RepID=UPI002A82C86D|nr:urease accessory protein UreE [Megamonas funiformis]MDY3875124.1 urease accessory protein UreE [Megamonas funiformis]
MIIEHIIGNISDKNIDKYNIDYVNIEWYECQKKIHRLTSSKGRDVAISLDKETQTRGLDDGDILYIDDDNTAIIVDILPAKAIIVKPKDVQEAIHCAYEIGNRHTPFFYADDTKKTFAIPYDIPFETLLNKMHVTYAVQDIKFLTKYRISQNVTQEHSHTHTHS